MIEKRSDPLDASTESEARDEVSEMFPNAAGITPADVRWYALGRGWKSLPSRNDAIEIFVKPESNIQIQVPQRGSDHDVAVMMKEVLRKLSELESRQLDEVSQDLRNGATMRTISISEAARLVGCSDHTVKKWVVAGLLPAKVFPSGRTRIEMDELRRFLDGLPPAAKASGELETR